MAQEKEFEKQVKQFLQANNCWVLKTWSNGVQREGVPDLLVCCNGHFIGVELKAEHGHPTELQKWNIRQINYAGGLAFTLYPDQFDEFKDLILSLQRGYGMSVESYVNDFNERWINK